METAPAPAPAINEATSQETLGKRKAEDITAGSVEDKTKDAITKDVNDAEMQKETDATTTAIASASAPLVQVEEPANVESDNILEKPDASNKETTVEKPKEEEQGANGDPQLQQEDAPESAVKITTKTGTTNTVTTAPTETGKSSTPRNPYECMRWTVIRNDGTPESMLKLVGLKSLFAKQLPKMPRAYIARLVFDPRHTSVAILSDNPAVKDSDEEIIGGICYRGFKEMRFAEIAFCAVNATHQVKGYGTKLMNLLKKTGAETGIEYFITYADNYAIGYFKKQGFTKSISMPKGRYFGLIKDYDGGTPMECYVHPSIDFLRVPEMLQAQRDFILSRVKLNTSSQNVYDPLSKDFKPNLEGVSRANHAAARAMAIPGILEAGWTMPDLTSATGQGKEADRQKSALKSDLLAIVRKIEEQQFAWPFREPVDTSEVADYLEVVKEPIDLSTIEKRIRQDNHYKSRSQLYIDLMLMVNNCKLYNEEASTYVQCAGNLERFLASIFHDVPAGRT
jgi:histone acetyltransferase